MPSWRALRTSDTWFTASDLFDLKSEQYFELEVEILRVAQGEAAQPGSNKKKKMPALYARAMRSGKELPKPLGLNATNGLAIESIVGSDDYKRWPGTKITFFVILDARDPSGGGKRPAIRIKPLAAGSSSAPPPPPASAPASSPPADAPAGGGFTSDEVRAIERQEAEEAKRNSR